MRLLDLFCGAGGAGEGYRRAGFDVTGVDIEPHDYPCGDFVRADALEVLAAPGFLAGFDVIHASPPCQAFSTITPATARGNHPELIEPVRELLQVWGGTYVIENVEGAKRHLVDPVRLCGSSFGLRVRRHRWFESNVWLTSMPCRHLEQGQPVGVYGDHPGDDMMRRPDGTRRGDRAKTVDDARDAMGISWMGWRDLAESIPPAYTEWIGHQLAEQEVAASMFSSTTISTPPSRTAPSSRPAASPSAATAPTPGATASTSKTWTGKTSTAPPRS